MSKKISDEQIDAMMKCLIAGAAADMSTVDDIADSPAVWWQVRRRIAEQKAAARSPWPPVAKLWRLAFVGVPVAVALLLAGILVFRPATQPVEQAGVQQNEISVPATMPSPKVSEPAAPAFDINIVPTRDSVKRTSPARRWTFAGGVYRKPRNGQVDAAKTEIKTDFIALSYASDAESGQIVRVRVPSSMMVTLGLVATVEKPTDLVDAEVIVGDDGLTRAIRFVR